MIKLVLFLLYFLFICHCFAEENKLNKEELNRKENQLIEWEKKLEREKKQNDEFNNKLKDLKKLLEKKQFDIDNERLKLKKREEKLLQDQDYLKYQLDETGKLFEAATEIIEDGYEIGIINEIITKKIKQYEKELSIRIEKLEENEQEEDKIFFNELIDKIEKEITMIE